MTVKDTYYVYGLIDPDTKLPFYIGKGIGNRAYDHLRLEKTDIYNMRKRNHIEQLLKDNKHIDIIFYETDLLYEEANDEEIRLIRKFGRRHIDTNGILLNLASGGEEGDTSQFFTEESRKKISNKMSGINNPRAKLNKGQVIDIYFSTELPEELSKKYNISLSQIFNSFQLCFLPS